MKKNELPTTDEMFCGMPRLKEYFKGQERFLKTFGDNDGIPAIRKTKQRREALLHTANNLTFRDLQILYYLHEISLMRKEAIVNALKALYHAQLEFQNTLLPQDEHEDIMDDPE